MGDQYLYYKWQMQRHAMWRRPVVVKQRFTFLLAWLELTLKFPEKSSILHEPYVFFYQFDKTSQSQEWLDFLSQIALFCIWKSWYKTNKYQQVKEWHNQNLKVTISCN